MADKLDDLKKAADELIRKYETDHILEPIREDEKSLIEAMRVYQHELELQHQQLLNSERSLEFAHHKYQKLFLAIPIPCLVLDSVGMITDCNESALSFFRCRNKTYLQRRNVFRLVDSDSANILKNYIDVHEPPKEFEHFSGHAFSDDVEWRHVEFTYGSLSKTGYDSASAILLLQHIEETNDDMSWQTDQAYQQNPALMFSLRPSGELMAFNKASKIIFKNILVPNINKHFSEVFETDLSEILAGLLTGFVSHKATAETSYSVSNEKMTAEFKLQAYPVFTAEKILSSVGFMLSKV